MSESHAPDVAAAGLSATRLGRADLDALRNLCARCSDFFLLVEGRPGGSEVAEGILSELAPGMGPESKHAFGFWRGATLVAAIDLVDGYPERGCWYVGLLVVEPAARGAGLGRAIWAGVESWTRARGGTHARLIVKTQNRRARAFWESRGFFVIDETVQSLPAIENRVWRLRKAFASPS